MFKIEDFVRSFDDDALRFEHKKEKLKEGRISLQRLRQNVQKIEDMNVKE